MSDEHGRPGQGHGAEPGAAGGGEPAGGGQGGGAHGHRGPLEPIGWMDKPDTVKRFFLTFYVICGLLLLAELVLGKETEHPHPYEWPVFFYAIYGFVSFWFLVLVAKPMRTLLIRSEDYYDE